MSENEKQEMQKAFIESVEVKTFMTRFYCSVCSLKECKSEMICHGKGVFFLYRCPTCGRGATSDVHYPSLTYVALKDEDNEKFLGTNIEEVKSSKSKRKKKND